MKKAVALLTAWLIAGALFAQKPDTLIKKLDSLSKKTIVPVTKLIIPVPPPIMQLQKSLFLLILFFWVVI